MLIRLFICHFFLNYSLNSIFRVLIQSICVGTNLLLIKFITGFCALFCGICCFVLQIALRKTFAQRGDKRKHMDESQFHSTQHFK